MNTTANSKLFLAKRKEREGENEERRPVSPTVVMFQESGGREEK